MKKIEITTHRGGIDRFPENSLAAFLDSWSQHTIPEMDIQRAYDGTLFVCHDETLDRTVEKLPQHLRQKPITEISYPEIQGLTLISGKRYFSPPIPTLEEVLSYLKKDPHKKIIIDNKTASLREEILPLIEYYGVEKQVWITTLSVKDLEETRERSPLISTQLWITCSSETADPVFTKALENRAIDSILLIISEEFPLQQIEENYQRSLNKKHGLFIYYNQYTSPLVQALLAKGISKFAVDSITHFKSLL